MKKILIIGTGGTISSAKGPEGLHPVHSINNLMEYIPEISGVCHTDTYQMLNIDSTNMQPEHWVQIAAAIWERYSLYDGFVITHGTDTMAYTAAILSYMIQNSPKPVVISGSQKPIDVTGTDARRNLVDSIYFACTGRGGIYIVFGGRVINGCRAVKIRTKSSNAFESVNYPFVASIDGPQIDYNPAYSFPQDGGQVKYSPAMATQVFLLKLMPGMNPEIFDFIVGRYKGVVIESFGNGGVPFIGKADILGKIGQLTGAGIIVVITTQCLFEGGDLNLYEVGQKLMKNMVIPAYDMTTEASVTKLMWVLGQTLSFEEAKKLFLSPVNNDITLLAPDTTS